MTGSYTLTSLIEERSRILGEVVFHNKEIKRLEESLVHINAVIKHSDPSCDLRLKEVKPHSINNKINRGTFSAIFLIQCLKAIGCEILRI